MNFYTNVAFYKGKILLKGVKDGQHIQSQIPYQPYLFVHTNAPSEYKTIEGMDVERIEFRTAGAARDYINRYRDVANYKIYGMTQWVYPFIYDMYASQGQIHYDKSQIRILTLDIETETGKYDDDLEIKVREDENSSEITTTVEQLYKYPDYQAYDILVDGWVDVKRSCYLTYIEYSDPKDAEQEVNAVTIRYNDKSIVLGFYEWTPKSNDITYIQCANEKSLLNKVIDIIRQIDPAIVTGWNSSGYDIPYLTNRCVKILGEERAKQLSPWNLIDRKTIHDQWGNDIEQIQWVGISSIDYIDTYRKFQSATEESYKLDYIANIQLNVGKVDYSEYGSLRALYILNRALYYEYNEIDVRRLTEIEHKLKLFDVQLSLAYYMGVNYIDVFGTVRPWDAFIHNYLLDRGIVVPQSEVSEQEDKIEGAHVKEPEPGMYNWVVSFDVKSLYPSLSRQCNISPETLIDVIPNVSVDACLNKTLNPTLVQRIKEENVSLCATGCIFDNSEEGFIAACMRMTYEQRVEYQAEYKKYRSLLNTLSKTDPKYDEIESKVAYFKAQQHSRKIAINSLYGATASRFFRWYDRRLAESITKTGQVAIRHVAKYINKFLNHYCGTKDVDYIIYIDTDSVVGSTIVNTSLGDISIEALYNEISKNATTKKNEDDNIVLEPKDTILSLSANKDIELENKPIKYIMKHKVKKKLYRITHDKDSVVVTEDHSIIVFRDKKIQSIRPADLKQTDQIIKISKHIGTDSIEINNAKENNKRSMD